MSGDDEQYEDRTPLGGIKPSLENTRMVEIPDLDINIIHYTRCSHDLKQ
jgi:hypothetical protein